MNPLLFIFPFFGLFQSVIGVCRFSTDKQIEDRCYSFVNKYHQLTAARGYCESYGSTLATVDNMIINKYLANFAISHFGKSFGYFWIGLSRKSSSSEFQWDDGTPYSFSNFAKGFPNSHNYVAESIHNGKWESKYGYDELVFVCSYPINSTTPAPPTTTTTPTTTIPYKPATVKISTTTKKPGCPEGFTHFPATNKCYSVITYGNDSDYPIVPDNSPPLTREAQRCSKYGANLATIHSEELNDHFRSLIYDKFGDTRYATIGMINTDSTGDGNWQWYDGSAKDFTNFGDSFPKSGDSISQMSINGYWVTFTHTSPNEGVICSIDY